MTKTEHKPEPNYGTWFKFAPTVVAHAHRHKQPGVNGLRATLRSGIISAQQLYVGPKQMNYRPTDCCVQLEKFLINLCAGFLARLISPAPFFVQVLGVAFYFSFSLCVCVCVPYLWHFSHCRPYIMINHMESM